MAKNRIVDTTRTPSVVTHSVKVDGNGIPEKYKAEVVVIDKEINRIPSAKVVIIDGEASEESFKASNESFFIPGKEIEIYAGYESDKHLVFKGIIIKHTIKIRDTSSLLILDCKDKCIKMTIGEKNKYFTEDVKDSDIISEICNKYGLKTDIEDTSVTHKEIVQFYSTDWDFIISRADVNGKLCFADDGKITIKKPDLTQTSVTSLVYGSSIIEMDVEIDARTQYKSVVSQTWNSDNQELSEKEVTNPSVSLNGNLSPDVLADVIGLDKYVLNHGGDLTDPELQAWGDSFWYKHQLSKITGRIKLKGVHTIKPGMLIELSGLSDRFNGKCFISGIRHHISAGDWQLDLQLGINPEWFTSQYTVSAKPASGILPAISGLQIGKVTQLEKDPEGKCRIKVYLPVISKNNQGIWARVATLDAGKERGSFFLPEINDEVIVGFINDDPRDAIILGMLNSSAKPAPLAAEDANDKKGFVTRSKIQMIFNDKDKSFTLETPVGKKIIVDENKGVISLEDENGNKILMDKNGISIESYKELKLKATTDLKIEGVNLTLKGSAGVTAEGSGTMDIKSNGITTIKGSMVNIN